MEMSDRIVQRHSQGTDMYEFLRFPDAIAYEDVVRRCNRLAIPLGNRSVTNKCYILLWKATYFPSSVFIGVRTVLEKLQSILYVPCLVILAGDTYIDGMMGSIKPLCIEKDIPYIFIPNKASIADALCVDNDVLAVFISFNHDPGVRKEFEDAFEGIRSQCFNKKRKRVHHRVPAAMPSETGPRRDKPKMVSTFVSTVPPGCLISSLLCEAGPSSSSSEWFTISEHTDDDSECTRDFAVNVPDLDATGNKFQEYILVSSPTPAPPPSQMIYLQNQNNMRMQNDESSTATCSGEESPKPGPSSEYFMPLKFPHKRPPMSQRERDLARKRRTWPIPLPYAPREDGAGERPFGDSNYYPGNGVCTGDFNEDSSLSEDST